MAEQGELGTQLGGEGSGLDRGGKRGLRHTHCRLLSPQSTQPGGTSLHGSQATLSCLCPSSLYLDSAWRNWGVWEAGKERRADLPAPYICEARTPVLDWKMVLEPSPVHRWENEGCEDC